MKNRKLFATIAAIIMVVACLSITAAAGYQYQSTFYDTVSTVSSQSLSKHAYTLRDIGASNIQITAPSAQDYYLKLYTQGLILYSQYGSQVIAGTQSLGGYYYWENANPNNNSTKNAYIKIEKKNSNTVSLGGGVYSRSRLWQ
jgi:hypothetical protein